MELMVGSSISLGEGLIAFYPTSMLAGKMSERYYMNLHKGRTANAPGISSS